MSKPILYHFPVSIWCAVPKLAIRELGLTDEIQQEVVQVMDGGNFEVDFVRKNPQATVPTLVTPDGKVYNSSTAVVEYAIHHAPQSAKVGKPADPKLLELIHADIIDPNIFITGVRNREELEAKIKSVPGDFVRGRQATLLRVVPTAPPELKAFYDAKLAANTGVLAVYTPGAPDEVVTPYFKATQDSLDAIGNFITTTLPQYLPEHGFIGGDVPGEADFHLGAWMSKVAVSLGAKNEKGQFSVFSIFGAVPTKVANYWDAWVSKESWNYVYKNGLY